MPLRQSERPGTVRGPSMLLILAAQSLLLKKRSRKGEPDLFSIPTIARRELDLAGLCLPTTLLAGIDAPRLERFRDTADKACCPCLILVEPQPQPLGHPDPTRAEAAEERIDRVFRAAHRLGCSSVVISLDFPSPAPSSNASPPLAFSQTDLLVARLKTILVRAERLELNLLLAPAPGLTETPEGLTTLIRRIGGFRIGAFPDFQTAAAQGDPTPYLRALAPYANALSASVADFDAKGRHKSFDLQKCVTAIQSVGFDATMTLDYRGKGDPIAALAAAKAAIESCLSEGPAKDSDE